MLDPKKVSGTYQDPDCKCCTLDVKAAPAVGILCMIQKCGGVPCCCYCAPFNCAPGCNCNGGSTKVTCGGCGRGGPKAAPCLPNSLTLAATWFCVCGACWDWYDDDTMLTSKCCICPQVHRKIKQGTIIC